MTDPSTHTPPVRLLLAGEGDTSSFGGIRNRFLLDGQDTGGGFALVEHQFQPRALAAPIHRQLAQMAATYGCEMDLPATFPVVERHGPAF